MATKEVGFKGGSVQSQTLNSLSVDMSARSVVHQGGPRVPFIIATPQDGVSVGTHGPIGYSLCLNPWSYKV